MVIVSRALYNFVVGMQTIRRGRQQQPLSRELHLRSDKKSLPRTELSSERRRRTPSQTNLFLGAKKLVPRSPPQIPLYTSQKYISPQRTPRLQLPLSPVSTKAVSQRKEKMRLEAEARQAFLGAVAAGTGQQPCPGLQKSESIREYLKTEFQNRYQTKYQQYFSKSPQHNQKLVGRPQVLRTQKVDFRFLKNIDYFNNERTPMHITLPTHVLGQQKTVQDTVNPHVSSCLEIQSQIKQFRDNGAGTIQGRVGYFPQMVDIVDKQLIEDKRASTNVVILVSDPPPNIPPILNQVCHPLGLQQQNKSVSFKQLGIVSEYQQKPGQDLNSSTYLKGLLKSNSYLSRPSQNDEQPSMTEKIEEYLSILQYFSTNVVQFDDLTAEPNSVSGIVGFYLYKRFLKEKQRLLRCLQGGSNIFSDIDYYEVTDQQLNYYRKQVETKNLSRQISLEIMDSQENLRSMVDYLKKQLGKDFPKANLDTLEPFEAELRYYVRMEAQQIKNKLDFNLQSPRSVRLMQRLAFLYESVFLVTFWNGEFVKNYQLYQEIPNLKDYLQEHQQSYQAFIRLPPK